MERLEDSESDPAEWNETDALLEADSRERFGILQHLELRLEQRLTSLLLSGEDGVVNAIRGRIAQLEKRCGGREDDLRLFVVCGLGQGGHGCFEADLTERRRGGGAHRSLLVLQLRLSELAGAIVLHQQAERFHCPAARVVAVARGALLEHRPGTGGGSRCAGEHRNAQDAQTCGKSTSHGPHAPINGKGCYFWNG